MKRCIEDMATDSSTSSLFWAIQGLVSELSRDGPYGFRKVICDRKLVKIKGSAEEVTVPRLKGRTNLVPPSIPYHTIPTNRFGRWRVKLVGDYLIRRMPS